MRDNLINITGNNPDELFASLAEQVKTPFVQISNASELLHSSTSQSQQETIIKSIKLASKSAISLIDSYLLNSELGRQKELELETVSLSSVVYDVAQTIDDFAKLHGCSIELLVKGKYGPVIANSRAIYAALTSLGFSFVEACSVSDSKTKPTIQLAVRRTAHGINTGVFADSINITSNLLNQARELRGKVHQPFSGFDSTPGAGVFLADELFSRINSQMRVSKFNGLTGLSATLLPSQQLRLV